MSFPCFSSHLTLTYDSEDVFLVLHLAGSESHIFNYFSCRDPNGSVRGGLHAGALGSRPTSSKRLAASLHSQKERRWWKLLALWDPLLCLRASLGAPRGRGPKLPPPPDVS